MIPPNRLEISPKVKAIRIGSDFAVSFPYDEAAKRVAWHGPRAHWDPGMKAWCMSGHDVARVTEVMEQIHGALVVAGKDREEDRAPKAWIDWNLVPSVLLPHDRPDLDKGEVLRLEHGHVVIERIGEPFIGEANEPGVKWGMAGSHVCRVWHRPALAAEIEAHHARFEDENSPEM